jgi:hypothetical protein
VAFGGIAVNAKNNPSRPFWCFLGCQQLRSRGRLPAGT